MKKRLSVVLVGISGMGSVYLEALLDSPKGVDFCLVGAVDPMPERCSCLEDLHRLGIPLYPTLEDFYLDQSADLVVIASPIHFHAPQTCLALARGSHVLCEKPVAATIQEAGRMAEAERRAKRRVAVGYQWSFSSAIQRLKRDIQEGVLGRPRRLKCLYLWPRDMAYYSRNDWAGKKRDEAGRWILDSPANNAMAHDLHNMFYVLGRTRTTSARPLRVEAELYRAFPIENFDTAALRSVTEEGTEILFYVSHATAVDCGPVLEYEFEKGRVEARGRSAPIRARLPTGKVIDYGSPDDEPLRKLWEALDMVKKNAPPSCGLRAAMSQTLCLNGAQDSMPEIVHFPRSLLCFQKEGGTTRITVRGLEDILTDAYEKNLLPSELGISWSKRGKVIELSGYRHFPGGSTS